MPPPASKLGAVVDAVVTRLLPLKDAFDADLYHVKPATVRRGVLLSALTIAARPIYCVQVLSYARARVFAGRHTLTPRIGVHVLADHVDGVEALLIKACRDIEYRLEGDERLGGTVQHVGDVEVEIDQEVQLAHQIGYALVSFPVTLTTDHTAP